MRVEFEAAGHDIQFLVINKDDAVDDQPKLAAMCSFPLFQDLPEVGAWDLHGGSKDDFFVFAADGSLAAFIPIAGDVRPDLSTPEGYALVKDAALDALTP